MQPQELANVGFATYILDSYGPRNLSKGKACETFPTGSLRRGDAFTVTYTPPNTKHFGRNATDKLSKTPVIRIKAKDKPVMTEVK